MLSEFKYLFAFKGVWIPIVVSTLFIIVSFVTKSEAYYRSFQPIEDLGVLYNCIFFFCCLPLYFINKVNFNFINSQFNLNNSLTNRLTLLLSFSIAFTLLSTITGLIIFSLYEVPFSDIHLLKINSYIFLSAFFCTIMFNYLLSIRNSMGFLFLIFLLPMVEIIGAFFSRLFHLNVERFFPFRFGANEDNLPVVLVLILVFATLSIKSHKTYYL